MDRPTLIDELDLSHHGTASALIGRDREVSYTELAEMVARRGAELDLPARSVVVLSGTTSIEWIVTYLALLDQRHVPLLAGDHADRLIDAWSPDAAIHADASGWTIERFEPARTELHPSLALLMSTSGSTGSPKLVRLSTVNLVANAASIAEFQRLSPDDRGITSLPLHYSFGLSILHSHLIAGAGLVVTEASVVDPCFVAAMNEHGVTNLAGVPYTFDLIEQAGADRVRVDSLRFLAQAGGRMEPATTASWAQRAERWGAEWFTMYGQTEATARIAFVPPDEIGRHPHAIGGAIPGGEVVVEPIDSDSASPDSGFEIGEIVYRGPNVMLGYATEPGDLALGRSITELRTGDLGRFDPATGLLEIVGRRSRHVKPFGLRIDLDDVERRMASRVGACVMSGDDELLVATGAELEPESATAALVAITGLPAARIRVLSVEAPRTSSGKIDHGELVRRAHDRATVDVDSVPSGERLSALQQTFVAVLGLEAVDPSDSFVSLGGDSLSYVECSIRIEQLLGRLPTDWHLTPIAKLAATDAPRQRLARVDTTVVLRTIGILAVVSTHMRFRHVPGGAHLMLGVVGYNLARFMMPVDSPRERMRAGLRTVGRVAVPTLVWTAVFMLAGQYSWSTLSLVNNYVGPRSHAGNHWHFWFIEVFVHLVVITTLLYAVPAVRRLDRRLPYAFPLALLAATITLRFGWADLGDWYNLRFRTHAVAWFFVLGWLIQRSATWQQRAATTIICLASAPGVFHNPRREFFIAFGLVLLVWVKEVPLPRFVVRPVATVAAASMWILISHFMIWPPLKSVFIVEVAYPLTVLASVAVWWLATNAPRFLLSRIPSIRPNRRIVSRSGAPAVSIV